MAYHCISNHLFQSGIPVFLQVVVTHLVAQVVAVDVDGGGGGGRLISLLRLPILFLRPILLLLGRHCRRQPQGALLLRQLLDVVEG